MYSFWNNTKTAMLMAGLIGLCMGAAYLIAGPEAIIPALIFGGAMNVVAFFFSDRIAMATMHAKPVEPGDDPVLLELVRGLAERAHLPMPKVFISPAKAPNAFATGRSPRKAAVCVTKGLRELLGDEELAGVIAHELAHVKHRDTLISTVAAVMGGAISALAYFALWFGGGRRDRGNPLAALLVIILAPIAAGIIRMAISRSREFEADREGARLVGSSRGLARALEKLHFGNSRIPLAVPDAASNMFIVAPLTGRRVASLFMTHPPVEERVKRLLSLEKTFA